MKSAWLHSWGKAHASSTDGGIPSAVLHSKTCMPVLLHSWNFLTHVQLENIVEVIQGTIETTELPEKVGQHVWEVLRDWVGVGGRVVDGGSSWLQGKHGSWNGWDWAEPALGQPT